ncbi:MAG: pyrroline-5-carboxylate reductase [Gammaproteobacteria bacterium]|nr:pyrroline-5-carboxylate reductase [Gammaproteobacteria bacterium]
MENTTIGFVGAGNMANSLIRGLLVKGCNPSSIIVADVDQAKLQILGTECGVRCGDNQSIADEADIIVLAVKPQVMETVCNQITLNVSAPLVVSIAAGIRIEQMLNWLGSNTAVVRCMPNTPALIGKGASGLYANKHVTDAQKQLAQSLMEAVGIIVWVDDENDIDTVTAVSGSGPAYFFLFMEAMQDAAKELGLSEELAKQLVYQTASGAVDLAIQSKDSTAELRRKVTSPGGTTERAIKKFEAGDIRKLVNNALVEAKTRSIELSKEMKN